MDVSKWGSPLWFFLHTISFNYPDKPSYKDKSQYYDFFYNLQNILPCQQCKINYIKHLQRHPISPHLDSRQSLVNWVVKIHNLVNIETGKPMMDTASVINKYNQVYQNTGENKGYCHYFDNDPDKKIKEQKQENIKMWKQLMLGVIVFIILSLVYFYNYRNSQKPQIYYM